MPLAVVPSLRHPPLVAHPEADGPVLPWLVGRSGAASPLVGSRKLPSAFLASSGCGSGAELCVAACCPGPAALCHLAQGHS
eukprot:15475269-Alexandrium_andersonii.AAC.1